MTNDAKAICRLNDLLRTTFMGGDVHVTCGVAALDDEARAAILTKVREFDAFDRGNDPYGEHDFGSFEHAAERYLWKIAYYAKDDFTAGSENPADPRATSRVLTIMRADEY